MKAWSTLKNHHLEQIIFRNRIQFAFLTVGLLSLVLVGRIFFLQVIQYERYQTASDENRIQVVPLPPTRGLIFDRNNKLLADNKPNFSLSIVVEKSPDIEKTLKLLTSLVEIKDYQLERFHKRIKQYRRPFEPIHLRAKLSEKEIAILAANRHQFPEVKIAGELIRNYPHKNIFSHSIGYVGRLNAKEQNNLENPGNYKGTNYIGKTGLERYYESALHGTTGLQKIETDAHGKILQVLEEELPVPGHNLYLHLDYELQKKASELLGERRGAVVAIEPKTGGVLAFVSRPGFNPNLFVTGISQKDYSALRDSPNQPLFNRTIQGTYPPGSTIKPIVGLAGLEYNKTFWWKRIQDPGWYKLESEERLYRDWKREGHGKVGLDKAIYQSCDTFFYDLALDLGIDNIHSFMSPFGFGTKTGIDIGPESRGILPSREWKKANRGSFWYPGETLIAAIGQGFMLSTPLQLGLSTAILANKGVKVSPKLVQSIENPEKVKISPMTESQGSIVIKDEKNWDRMFNSMKKVMHYNRGTAFMSGLGAKYKIAGKTGTAQVKAIAQGEEYDEEETALRHRDHSLFIGFAPIEEPKIALAVIIENGGSGSAAAAPLARKLFDNYLLR
jgi:penicillin-binding protein 2